jgi:hypothetical protein
MWVKVTSLEEQSDAASYLHTNEKVRTQEVAAQKLPLM